MRRTLLILGVVATLCGAYSRATEPILDPYGTDGPRALFLFDGQTCAVQRGLVVGCQPYEAMGS